MNQSKIRIRLITIFIILLLFLLLNCLSQLTDVDDNCDGGLSAYRMPHSKCKKGNIFNIGPCDWKTDIKCQANEFYPPLKDHGPSSASKTPFTKNSDDSQANPTEGSDSLSKNSGNPTSGFSTNITTSDKNIKQSVSIECKLPNDAGSTKDVLESNYPSVKTTIVEARLNKISITYDYMVYQCPLN